MEIVTKYIILIFLALFSSIGMFLINRSRRTDRNAAPAKRQEPAQPAGPARAEEQDLRGFFSALEEELPRDPLTEKYVNAVGLLRQGNIDEATKLLGEAAYAVPGHQNTRVAKHVFQLLYSIHEDTREYFKALQAVEMALSYFPSDRGFQRARRRLINKISHQMTRPGDTGQGH